jgi:hypothetical protein
VTENLRTQAELTDTLRQRRRHANIQHGSLARLQGARGDQLACLLAQGAAAALKKTTRGLVLAGLRPALTPDGSFWVGFDLYSPALGENSYRLFQVTYPPEFFPITLTADGSRTAQTLEEFKAVLESVIRSPRTKQVIEAIMAQATALGPAGAENEG